VVGGGALDRLNDDLLGLAIGLLAGAILDLLDRLRGLLFGFFDEVLHQDALGLLVGDPANLLETPILLLHQIIELSLPLLDALLPPLKIAFGLIQLFFPGSEQIMAPVEVQFACCELVFRLLQIAAAQLDLIFKVLT